MNDEELKALAGVTLYHDYAIRLLIETVKAQNKIITNQQDSIRRLERTATGLVFAFLVALIGVVIKFSLI